MLAWYPDPYRYGHKGVEVPKALDWRYVLRNLKGPVGYAAVTCGTYSGVECLMQGLRNKDANSYTNPTSTWQNSAVGGAAAGAVMGSLSRRLDIMAVSALGVGMLMGMLEFNAHYKVIQQVNKNNKDTSLAQPEASTTPTMIPPTLPGVSVASLKLKYPAYKDI
jgi:hypothetical protein